MKSQTCPLSHREPAEGTQLYADGGGFVGMFMHDPVRRPQTFDCRLKAKESLFSHDEWIALCSILKNVPPPHSREGNESNLQTTLCGWLGLLTVRQ